MKRRGFSLPKSPTRLLQDLISIPSVNPDGDPGHPQPGEQAIAEYVAAFLKKCGADVSLVPVSPGRPNVIGHFASSTQNKTSPLTFAPHLDTVSVRGMTIDPFHPILKEGKIFGRGASDTKGPMAAMLWAIKTWVEKSKRRSTPVVFTGLMGEEAGNEGAFHLVRSGFKSTFAIIGEPTEMKIVHAHKSALWFTVTTSGKSCHASTPERGINAITEMSDVIEALQKALPRFLHRHQHPQLGKPSFNIGTISGGSKVNIVPNHCQIECDIRTIPQCDAAIIETEIRKILKPFPRLQLKTRRNPPPA